MNTTKNSSRLEGSVCPNSVVVYSRVMHIIIDLQHGSEIFRWAEDQIGCLNSILSSHSGKRHIGWFSYDKSIKSHTQ